MATRESFGDQGYRPHGAVVRAKPAARGTDVIMSFRKTRLDVSAEALVTRRALYGYNMFTGRGARDLKAWLASKAETARSNEDLARHFVEQCRATRTILPGVTPIERLCADALVAAERRIEARITGLLDDAMRARLDALLTEDAGGSVTRFVWLRQFEAGQNSVDMNRLLDRLEFLQDLGLDETVLAYVPPHRIARLRRQGERYFAGDLRDISGDRRLAILAVCALGWRSTIADTIVETHDRIVGKTWRAAKSRCEVRVDDAKAALKDTLQSFAAFGSALLEAHEDRASLEEAVGNVGGWLSLKGLVATAAQLTDTLAADPLVHVGQPKSSTSAWPDSTRSPPSSFAGTPERVAFIRIHATRFNTLISHVREAQNRFPLLRNML